MTFNRLFMAGVLAASILSCTGGFAADIGDSDLQSIQLYYQPTLMASADEAIAALSLLHDSYCDWRGGRPSAVFATKSHVDMHTNIHTVEETTQWVPNWGGFIGPGGSYTPFMGGSNQTSQSEHDDGADITMAPAQILQISLWSYPNLERDFKYGFDLALKQSDGKVVVMSFRTSTIDIAHRLADAFATLAAANFTGDRRFMPSWGLHMDAKDLPAKFAKLGWTQPGGMLVDAILSDSPAQTAGLAANDIVVQVAGRPLADTDALGAMSLAALNGKPSGQVPIKVFRNGQTIDLTVPLVNPNTGLDKLLPVAAAPPPPLQIHLGVAARSLTPAEAKKAKRQDGVFIVGVDKGSLAEQMAIQAGDILLTINATKIPDMEALKKTLAAGGEISSVTVQRAGKVLTLNGVSKM